MKKIIKKKLQAMTVLYGLKLEAAQAAIKETDPCINVRHGWFHLHFGRNEKFGDFLLVMTMSDSFLLSTKPPVDVAIRKRRRSIEWVFSIESLPPDFLSNSSRCSFLSYGGFSVIHGRDHSGRDFLSVDIPARRLNMLFRDPDSLTAQAWSPRHAAPLLDGAEILPPLLGKAVESTGDAELDALLLALG